MNDIRRCLIAIVPIDMVVAAAAMGRLSYVDQTRRVEAMPDNDPPPTQLVRGPESQEASDFGPFAGSIHVDYYWGQQGYDYGGVAEVVQNSTLSPSGVVATGSVYAVGDTVWTHAASLLSTTFDVSAATPYMLTTRYEYLYPTGFSRNVGVVLQRVEAGGNVDLLRREMLLNRGRFADGIYVEGATDRGVLAPGLYTLQYAFTTGSDDFSNPESYSYDARLVVPDPSAALLLPGCLLLRRRR